MGKWLAKRRGQGTLEYVLVVLGVLIAILFMSQQLGNSYKTQILGKAKQAVETAAAKFDAVSK